MGITSTISLLPKPGKLHKSIAPLYYPILLYSIKESQENAENSIIEHNNKTKVLGLIEILLKIYTFLGKISKQPEVS